MSTPVNVHDVSLNTDPWVISCYDLLMASTWSARYASEEERWLTARQMAAPVLNARDSEPKYRLLEKGELILATDEADMCADGWRDEAKWEPAPSHCIGKPASDPQYPAHTKWRRKVES